MDDFVDFSDAVVRKSGNKWCIFSKKGKKLECFDTKKKAVDRLKEIEYFSQQDKSEKK